MESFMEDLLNFSIPKEEEDEEFQSTRNITPRKTGLSQQTNPGVADEEDLEWISNKDAFPVIETFIGVLPSKFFSISLWEHEASEAKQLSPIQVLERSSHNSTITMTTTSNSGGISNGTVTLVSCCIGFDVPVKARSKRRRTRRRDLKNLWTMDNEKGGGPRKRNMSSADAAVAMGRMCQHCGVDKTPQWRSGPLGPKTLCNACGVRYKSGRLVPEYLPVNSPTFSAELHSNFHRKIVEMKRKFLHGDGVQKDCG